MPYDDEELPYVELEPAMNELSHSIIGAAMEVHKELGPGLDEESYEEAMALELMTRRIPFERQVWVDVLYTGNVVGRKRIDFVIAGRVVVELKAVEELSRLHKAQVLTYLKITGHQLGLLINFNTVQLSKGVKRVIDSLN